MEDLKDLHAVLGTGASGTVKKMLHCPTNTLVAVKVGFSPLFSLMELMGTTGTGDSLRDVIRDQEQTVFGAAHPSQLTASVHSVFLWCVL